MDKGVRVNAALESNVCVRRRYDGGSGADAAVDIVVATGPEPVPDADAAVVVEITGRTRVDNNDDDGVDAAPGGGRGGILRNDTTKG